MAGELRIICLTTLTCSTQNHLCLLRLMVQKLFNQIYVYLSCWNHKCCSQDKSLLFSASPCTSVSSLRCWAVVLMWGMQVWIQLMSFPKPGFTLSVKILHIEKILRILERQSQTIICDLYLVLYCNILKNVSSQKVRNSICPICIAWRGSNFNFYEVMDVLMKVCL